MNNSARLKENLQCGNFDKRLLDIYVDRSQIDYQRKRYIDAICEFERLFGVDEVSIYSAPGRTEIGGNHTDHQYGQVLAAAINLDAIAIVSRTDDNIVRVVSGENKQISISTDSLEYKEDEKGTTISLIKGVLSRIVQMGYEVGGFSSYITSDVLIGAGLSSSAAFETLIGTIVSGLYCDGAISAPDIAVIGQYAENEYFGKPCGLMDQMSSSVGGLVHIDFSDINNPLIEKVDVDFDEFCYSICITDTLGSHSDLTHEYAAIPLEMEKVARCFGRDKLGDISIETLLANVETIRKECGDRAFLRAIHYVAENNRVTNEVLALREADIEGFLKLVGLSGDSSYKYLQNVYVSDDVTHQNVSVALAISDMVLNGGRGVSRVHGGGFAGTIQAFVKNEAVDHYQEAMSDLFGQSSCRVLKVRRYGGMLVI